MKKLKMRSHKTSGRLIVFCGLDGCGKSTMIEMLKNELEERGFEVFLTKQPTNKMRTSAMFREFTDNPTKKGEEYRALSLLCVSDRLLHQKEEILRALSEGKIVICDRYYYSCLANLIARGFEKDRWIYDLSRYVIKPDIAFFLDLPVGTAMTRVRLRNEEKERYVNLELQYGLRKAFKKICNANGGVCIKSEGDVSDTYKKLKRAAKKQLKKITNKKSRKER